MKKILSILLVIMLIITFVQIRNMYALYKDELSGEYETSLGKWNVKVNGTDIVSPGNVINFNMYDQNVRYDEESGYILAGTNVVAPGTEAFFDILIDTQGTEVAVKYEIEIGNTIEDTATGKTLVGQISSYKLIDYTTKEYIVDNTDDDVDASADDYLFDVPAPIKFEVVSVGNSFGTYSIDTNHNIVGTEAAAGTYTNTTSVDNTINIGSGVIPLNVSQTNGVNDKVTVRFKWVSDEDTMTEEEKEAVADMYKKFADLNEENKTIEFLVPVKVKAIQYFGEDL